MAIIYLEWFIIWLTEPLIKLAYLGSHYFGLKDKQIFSSFGSALSSKNVGFGSILISSKDSPY